MNRQSTGLLGQCKFSVEYHDGYVVIHLSKLLDHTTPRLNLNVNSG